MPKLNERQIKEHVTWLRDLAATIEDHAPHALKRDAGPTTGPDGYPTGGSGEGGRSSDRTSSTERQGTTLAGRGQQADPLSEALKSAGKNLQEGLQRLQIAASQYTTAATMGEAYVGRVSTVATCVNCKGPADPVKAGRCEACNTYRNTHAGKDRPFITPEDHTREGIETRTSK